MAFMNEEGRYLIRELQLPDKSGLTTVFTSLLRPFQTCHPAFMANRSKYYIGFDFVENFSTLIHVGWKAETGYKSIDSFLYDRLF